MLINFSRCCTLGSTLLFLSCSSPKIWLPSTNEPPLLYEATIEKIGPKEQLLQREADYQIIVSNNSETPLTQVIITDDIPAEISVLAATGATIQDQMVTWTLSEVKPHEKVSFNITTSGHIPGNHPYYVRMSSAEGCQASNICTTHFKGKAQLDVTFCDSLDPIHVGESTLYTAVIYNRGTDKDENLKITLRFPEQIEPLTDPIFELPLLGPHQSHTFSVEGRGISPGEAHVTLEVSSSSTPLPIIQQETTQVIF